jgi:hypothetical protein
MAEALPGFQGARSVRVPAHIAVRTSAAFLIGSCKAIRKPA